MSIRKIPADTATFHYFNANPKNQRACDCVVRAICTATGKKWEDVLQGLFDVAYEKKVMLNEPKCYDEYLKEIGWFKRKMPKHEDGTRYEAGELAKESKQDEVMIVSVAHHLLCIKERKVWDTWNSTRKCVGNYWVKG